MPTELTSNLHLLTPEFALNGAGLPGVHGGPVFAGSAARMAGRAVGGQPGGRYGHRPADAAGGECCALRRADRSGRVRPLLQDIFLRHRHRHHRPVGGVRTGALEHRGEFYGLLLFSILGMNLMAMSRELLTAYIALELLSFSLYVMVAYGLREARSNEAGIKYIIIGALSSAIMLYGLRTFTPLWARPTLNTSPRSWRPPTPSARYCGSASPCWWWGLGFKLSAAPFHMWAPDAYEGAPLPVTAYLAIGSKAAAFALTLRLFAEAIAPAVGRWDEWQLVIAVLAAITMLVGNLVALAQRNLKRLMAYSSIGHVGLCAGRRRRAGQRFDATR